MILLILYFVFFLILLVITIVSAIWNIKSGLKIKFDLMRLSYILLIIFFILFMLEVKAFIQ